GVNASGTTVPSGGFGPVISIFETVPFYSIIAVDNTGGTIGNDPLNRAPDPVTGFALDAYPINTPINDPFLGLILSPGTYYVSLSQWDTIAGGDLENGTAGVIFSEAGNPHFTGPYAGNPNGTFIDPGSATQRTGFWALDFVGVDSASIVTVP